MTIAVTSRLTQQLKYLYRVPRRERFPRLLRKLANDYLDRQRTGIFHIGAHAASEARFYGDTPVVWFEANPELTPKMLENIAPFPRQRGFCVLLGDQSREVDFNVCPDSGGSSSIFALGPYSAGPQSLWPQWDIRMEKTVRLQMETLDSFLPAHGIDPADYNYWVLDVQGAELLVLKGAKESLRHCKVISTEISTVEVYEGGARYEDIKSELASAEFIPLIEPHVLNMKHGDVAFVHRSLANSAYFRFLLSLFSWVNG